MKRARNVVLIMSGGSGTRFGADRPKQYCLLNGKPIIEYALDACRHASLVDEIVIVAAEEYVQPLWEKYGFPTTVGGENRTESLANGLQYVHDHYVCDNVIIANAVCPLMTEEQIDRYFKLLDDYVYVLTSWKVVSTLHTYRGELVDRNDYFHVMEPEAYRFEPLYQHYDRTCPVPYIFHQLPEDLREKGYYCFDYPHTMKITYSLDVKVAELLYDEIISKPKREKTLQNINLWLSSFSRNSQVASWIANIQNTIDELAHKWEITYYSVNPTTFATCVLEAHSAKYGDVIVKLHAPCHRFKHELAYYRCADASYMAPLLDYDEEYHALLIKKINSGLQVKFDAEDPLLRDFYDKVNERTIPADALGSVDFISTVKQEFEDRIQKSSFYNFHAANKKRLEDVAGLLWDTYFKDFDSYFLHWDLHRRNILKCYDELRAIDPMGVLGPKEFEWPIVFITEAKADPEHVTDVHSRLLDYFGVYCDKDRLNAAAFILWVHKMDEYIFAKNDNGQTAEWAYRAILDVYYGGQEERLEQSPVPSCFEGLI